MDHEHIFQDLDTAHTNTTTQALFLLLCDTLHTNLRDLRGSVSLDLKLRYFPDYYYCRTYCRLLRFLSPCGPHFKETSLSYAMLLSLPPTRGLGSTQNSLSRDAQSLLRTGRCESVCVCYILLWRRKQKDKDRLTETEKLPRTELQGRFKLWLSLCAVQRNWSWKQTEIMFSVTCSAPLRDPKT